MYKSAVACISEEWLQAFVYKLGKEGGTDVESESHFLLRLAEARASLRRGPREPRKMVVDSELAAAAVDVEDERLWRIGESRAG
jgi:hypothetical protein